MTECDFVFLNFLLMAIQLLISAIKKIIKNLHADIIKKNLISCNLNRIIFSWKFTWEFFFVYK